MAVNAVGTEQNGYYYFLTSGRTVGEVHTYSVRLVFNGTKFIFKAYIDSTNVANTSWTPIGVWPNPSATGWGLQMSGETHFADTGVSGVDNPAGYATVLSDAGVQRFSDDAFQNAPCAYTAINSVPDQWGLNGSANHGCGSWSIFTKS